LKQSEAVPALQLDCCLLADNGEPLLPPIASTVSVDLVRETVDARICLARAAVRLQVLTYLDEAQRALDEITPESAGEERSKEIKRGILDQVRRLQERLRKSPAS
jgi:hypothetical protein